MSKRAFIPSLWPSAGSGERADLPSLRRYIQAEPRGAIRKIQGLVERGEISLDPESKNCIRDLRNLYGALKDLPVQMQVPDSADGGVRTVTTGAFTLIFGGLGVQLINKSFDTVNAIGDQLVLDIDDPRKNTTLVDIVVKAPEYLERPGETDGFAMIGTGEERYDIGSNPKGLRGGFSANVVRENDMNLVQKVFKRAGEIPAEEIEDKTLRRVTDYDGSGTSPAAPYVLQRNRTNTSLFTTTANSPGPRTPSGTRIEDNPLTDGTSLTTARKRLVTHTNNRGFNLAFPSKELILLTPDALVDTASAILNSELVPGNPNERNVWGPKGRYQPTLLSSPRLDALSSHAWYMGVPKRIMRRKWKVRLNVATLSGQNTDGYVDSREIFKFSIEWDCEIGAEGYEGWIQCLEATTAPDGS